METPSYGLCHRVSSTSQGSITEAGEGKKGSKYGDPGPRHAPTVFANEVFSCTVSLRSSSSDSIPKSSPGGRTTLASSSALIQTPGFKRGKEKRSTAVSLRTYESPVIRQEVKGVVKVRLCIERRSVGAYAGRHGSKKRMGGGAIRSRPRCIKLPAAYGMNFPIDSNSYKDIKYIYIKKRMCQGLRFSYTPLSPSGL
jgi:hypothetical protein